MNAGLVIEAGALPNGTPYRVWKCRRTGKRIVYIGNGDGKRRSMGWLRKTLRHTDAKPSDAGVAMDDAPTLILARRTTGETKAYKDGARVALSLLLSRLPAATAYPHTAMIPAGDILIAAAAVTEAFTMVDE